MVCSHDLPCTIRKQLNESNLEQSFVYLSYSLYSYVLNLQFKTDSVLRVGQLFTNIGQYN